MSRSRCLAVACSCALTATLTAAPVAAQTKSSLASLLLQASDVPGFRQVSSADENLTDPNDQGPDQAFISCAQGHVLLDQFDTGGSAALTGPFWGEGVNSFGSPELSVASVAFGDGSVTDAERAEGELANHKFQRCWVNTTDTLDAQQGITIPVYASTLKEVADPMVGARSAEFVVNSTYEALGQSVQFQWDVVVVQEGAYVVMLVALAFDQTFPQSVLRGAAKHTQTHMHPSAPVTGNGSFAFDTKFGAEFQGRVALLKPHNSTSAMTATVNWGDGSVSGAQLQGSGTSGVAVYAHHTYWVTGKVPVTVTLSGGGRQEVFRGTTTVTSRYTAMGDSYSAGEGSDWQPGKLEPAHGGNGWWLYQDHTGHLDHGSTDYLDSVNPIGLPSGSGDMCHRSLTAYSHVVYRSLDVPGMTMHFVACSGGILTDMYSPASKDRGSHYLGERPQVDALSPATSLVTLTMGGNNLKFAGVAQSCVEATLSLGEAECIKQDARGLSILGYDTSLGSSKDGTYAPYTSETGLWAQTQSAAGMSLTDLYNWSVGTAGTENQDGNDLHDAFVLMLRKIKSLAPGARILVLGYPMWFPEKGTGGICSYFTNTEQLWINDRINVLDDIIHDAVNESGVAQYVSVYHALVGHEECQGPPTGSGAVYTVNKAGEVQNCDGQDINPVAALGGALGSAELLHPNPCGHLAESVDVVDAYKSGIQGERSFSVAAGSSGSFSFTVPAQVNGGAPLRANFSVQLSTAPATGALSWYVTSPDGHRYQPVQQGSVYATWDIPSPAVGVWSVTVASSAPRSAGYLQGSVWETLPALIPRMPPAGDVRVTAHNNCFLSRCTDTFRAYTNGPPGSVSGYDWYDDKGNSIGSGDTASMTSNVSNYKLVLRTNGYGEDRYTVYNCGDQSCTVESPVA